MARWTQQMAMHLNGGNKFSQMNFTLYADGAATQGVRITRTGGSPKYLKTVDKLCWGEDEFDLLTAKGGTGAIEWLNERLAKESTDAPLS